ncbi:hypothetical protein [Acetobacter sp.]|nr:hypothetical protein [Acetobacter sp.]MCH4091170.1 hypothetical protein [Acetobacter sp.]
MSRLCSLSPLHIDYVIGCDGNNNMARIQPDRLPPRGLHAEPGTRVPHV